MSMQVVARNLLETLRLVHGNKDDVARVITVLCGISEDYDPSVRQELMVQLPHITAFLKEVELSNQFLQYLVPMLISFLGDENNNVRKSCHSTVLNLIEQGFLDADTVSEKMCPLILHLTDNVHPEELRIESILLMSKLMALLGKKAAEELFLERLFTLCTDKSNNIRKACATTFGDISTTCGRKTTEEVLLPKFFTLCEDGAWCVRKACAENFMPISCIVSKETRHKELSSFYLILLADHSRWVRLTAFQALGPFISTFAEPDRTGLYYSKDGVLTIVDAPFSPDHSSSTDETTTTKELCNGDSEELASDNSSSDRTSSSIPCDSVVPLCSTDTSLSAQEVPGISCHVGNYCTVIEVSPPTKSPLKDISEACSRNSDSGKGSSSLAESANSREDKAFDAAGNVESIQNGSSMPDDVASLSESEEKFNNSLTKEEKEFNKLWYEAACFSDDGAVDKCNINGELAIEDTTLIRYSEDKSNVLSSITVNGVNLSSAITLSGPISCDSIPMISCNNSLKESPCKQECLKEASDAVPNLTLSQELSESSSGISVDDTDLSPQELKVNSESTDKECAFNYFQYWRDPLPDIEIDAESLADSSSTEIKLSSTFSFENSQRKHYNKTGYRRYRIGDNDMDREFMKLSQMDKGEPPPEVKLFSPQFSPHDQDIVPPELLLQYLNMIDAAWAQTIDAEIARHCAYSLPAVALTLGREFWPCLKDTFDALSSDLQGFIMMWKVRRTIASAMHQLAVILGPEITSRDLLPVFSRFINDLDEVRVGILQHLYEFLKVLRQEERNQFLPNLSEFLVSNSDSDSNEKNWRFRLILAEQLVSIVDLYEPRYIRNHLVPLTLTLIKDKVCEVRLATVRVMAAVMKQLSQSPTYAKAFISELTENFVHSPKWLYRQL
ncbi:hypothetical protein JTE90_015078 [Oedothorax gibbosus]|uniref:Phosphatase 2A Regulatory Subunit A helical domain-containing protein n=1 Tax=Oedothorax gibbosus TaxID=931172 RepID=A0AAV6VQ61_9ARAC|nr:hypothetical protein JTE90_015078 [Oedothorax gibbosus]